MSSAHSATTEPKEASIFTQPWGTTWRKAMVSLPRLVPDLALHFTSPEGPHPIAVKLPSRGKHSIPVYIFIPDGIVAEVAAGSKKSIPCPLLLDFHGGGFVLGSCQEQAPFCAKLCRELGCIAISVDYRLGPAAQFPAALEDAEDILNAIISTSKPGHNELRMTINDAVKKSASQNQRHAKPPKDLPIIDLDTTRIALSGFSSGGNLALNLAISLPTLPETPLLSKPWPSPVPESHQTPLPVLLFYPSLDLRLLPHQRPRPAGLIEPKGFLANLNLEAELVPTYLPRHLTSHPRASPGLISLSRNTNPSTDLEFDTVAHGTLHPSAHLYLLLPEFDNLSSQSETWIRRVQAEGRAGQLSVHRVPGVVHGWTQFPDGMLEEPARRVKQECFDRAVEFVREAWALRVTDT